MFASRTQRLLASVIVTLLAAAGPPRQVDAQSVYGGIRGTVSDSLGPVPGAQVTLVGTAFTARANAAGRFAIDHVPAGSYAVRAAIPGRDAGEVTGAQVPSDGVVSVRVRLGRHETAGAVPVVADRGLATRTRLYQTDLSERPVDDSRQALGFLPGVVMRGTDLGVADVPDLTIRGSAADQTSVFVDGAPARFEILGLGALDLPGAAIGEMSVASGPVSAATAGARGAAISYVMRSGGPRFEAGLRTASDAPFSRAATVGYNRFDAFAGGPVPGVARLTWLVAGALYGQSSSYRGSGADTVPTFALAGTDTTVTYTVRLSSINPADTTERTVSVPRFAQVSGRCGQLGSGGSAAASAIRDNYGYDCEGLRQILDWTTSRRVSAKLLFTYGEGSSLSLTALASDDQHRDNPGQDLVDDQMYAGMRRASQLAVLNWSHHLSQLAHGALRVTGNVSVASDSYQSGPLDPNSALEAADPALGIEFSRLRFAGLDGLPLPLTDAVIREMREGAFVPPFDLRPELAPVQEFRFNPYGAGTSWPTSGFGGTAVVASETRLDGRIAAEWAAERRYAVAVGADFSRTDLSSYQGAILVAGGWGGFLAHPRRAGLFALGRLSGDSGLVEVGVRLDRYETGSDFPKVPGLIYRNPAWILGDTSYDARVARVFDPGRTQTLVSPSVRASYQLLPGTSVRAGISQSVEVPPYQMLFAGVNTDQSAYSSTGYGRDVSYVKSTLWELGFRRALSPSLVADVSGYFKTNPSPYVFQSAGYYNPIIGGDPSQPNYFPYVLTAAASNDVLGGDLRFEANPEGAVGGSLSYSIERTRLSLSYPLSTPSTVVVQPADVTTQALAGTLVLQGPATPEGHSPLGAMLQGARAVLTGRVTSGEPYSEQLTTGSGLLAPGIGCTEPTGQLDCLRLPWTTSLDLRISKAVTVGRMRWTAYIEARNVLNLQNVIGAFAETGKPTNLNFEEINFISPQMDQLRADAGALWTSRPEVVNGVTQSVSGIDLTDCARYPQYESGGGGVPDCLALRQVEARWGNGDEFYDTNEINRALNAWYDAFYGTWIFHGPARTARVGLQVEF